MKKKIYILAATALSMAISLSSCSGYLDEDRYFKDLQTIDHIFENRDYTEQWLATAYNFLWDDNTDIGTVDYNITNYDDDMIFNERNDGEWYRKFKFGEYDYSWFSGSWSLCYKGIRQASIFIQNVDKNKDFTAEQIADLKAQAHFLRGFYYWLLIRKYGPVPIMPEEGANYDDSYSNLSTPRSTYDDCAEYIANEMVLAAKDLPLKRDNISIGRPTRGAALAVRAKAYLYAASPLYNGNTDMADFTDKEGNKLISQTYDENKWAKAAAAAKDVIELGKYKLFTAHKLLKGNDAFPATIAPPYNEKYSNQNFPDGWADIDPFLSYRGLFDGEVYAAENPELIYTRGVSETLQNMVRHQLPVTGGGYNCHGITGKQCDAYEMADGTPFDRNKSPKGQYTTQNDVNNGNYRPLKANVNLEYANREPRFYASVAFNGALWCFTSKKYSNDRYKQIWYYRGEKDGHPAGSERWIPTGIGMMKYVHPEDAHDDADATPHIVKKIEPTIRYADILLMYAEALNELTTSYTIKSWDGSTTYTISRDINEMSKGIAPVRIRAGLPDYDAEVYASKDLFRTKLKHERQVELFAENQRYYDIRRWKDAPVEEAKQIYGCNMYITNSERDLFYEQMRVPNLQTAFSRKMYFWPINYDELKRNKNMTQAPGWKDYD